MIKRIKTNKKKGFTLIELIVVMAVIGILVLLAMPRFLGQTKEAQFTKHINNAKVLEDASARYYIDHGKWPRGADDDVYTPEEVASYAERIYDFTGKEIILEEGDYWDIDYDALNAYAKLPNESEQANYVLRNPVGKIYYLEGLTEVGEGRLPIDNDSKPVTPIEPSENPIPDYYVQVTDADFTKGTQGNFRYTGTVEYVIIPDTIKGVPVTSYRYMFCGDSAYGVSAASPVKGVVSTNPNVTDMSYMFNRNQAETLDLSNFNTTNVTNMGGMFVGSKATTLDLSSFNTANVTDMNGMFSGSQATTLDLSSFNTANVTNMELMFQNSQATTLDLSSFNTANVTTMRYMFSGSKATTLDLSSFNTANVTTMGYMFWNSRATTLDLSSFDTAKVTTMELMFRNSAATNLNLNSFNTANVTNMYSMFQESEATSLDLSSFNTAKVTDMRGMFYNSKATSLDLRSFDLRNIVTGTTSTTSKNWQMFKDAAARTGYARTTSDRDKLNNTYTGRPSGLAFIVK